MTEPVASPLRAHARAIAAAFTFLTRLPVGRVIPHDLGDLSQSAAYFPLVGLVVGAIGGAVFVGAQFVWSPLVAVVLSVASTVLVTGAFHEDALADSLDGFGGGWTKAQVLMIMKDSRVGSYALIGVVLVVLAKVASLLSINEITPAFALPQSQLGHALTVARALVVAHVFARWSSVCLMHTHEYVRIEEPGAKPSAGRPFVNSISNTQLAVATVISLTIVLPLLHLQAIYVGVATVGVTMLTGRYFQRRIGGITGDALGAANQLVELSVYLVLSVNPIAATFK